MADCFLGGCMRKYCVRLLTMLCMILCVSGLHGCNKNDRNSTSEEVVLQSQTVEVQTTEQSSESSNEGGNDIELTQEYVCSEFGISESEFEGVDFDRFVDYYGLTYENIQNELVAYLLQEYQKNNGETEFYDYKYMYNSDKDAVLTLDNQNSISIVFCAQIEDDLNRFWIFDFEKGIKITDTGAENVIHKDSIVSTLTPEHREQVLELFEKYDVYTWYENREERNSGDWYLSVKFQDGTIALVSGSAKDSDVDFDGLLSEITDIGE